jgi:hypothetical protein
MDFSTGHQTTDILLFNSPLTPLTRPIPVTSRRVHAVCATLRTPTTIALTKRKKIDGTADIRRYRQLPSHLSSEYLEVCPPVSNKTLMTARISIRMI